MPKNKQPTGLTAINAAGAAAAKQAELDAAEAAKKAEAEAKTAAEEDALRAAEAEAKAEEEEKAFNAAIESAKAAESGASAGVGKTLDKSTAGPVEGRIDAQMANAAAAHEPPEAPELDEKGVPVEPKKWFFVSPHPSIVVYVDIPGKHELDRAGNPVPVSVPIEFENGVYSTTDMTIAALLRERALTMRQVFRLENDPQALAVLEETHRQTAMIKAGVVGGISTAGDDNPQEVAKAQAHLQTLRGEAYNGGL